MTASRTSDLLTALRREILRKLHQDGFWKTARSVARKLVRKVSGKESAEARTPHPFDIKYGTDTGGTVDPGSLDIPSNRAVHAIRYQTAVVEVFEEILRAAPITYPQTVFVDLGSGKGRALLLASQFPFREIVGVELSPSLHQIATRNIHIYCDAAQQCHRIKSICGDVADFDIPADPVFFYLFNPFDESVLQAVMANIKRSWLAAPRPLHLAYLKPVHRHVLDQADFLEICVQSPHYVIYATKPPEKPVTH